MFYTIEKYMKEYDPPMSKEQIKHKSESLYKKLMNCPVHEFRARTGIELIHKEPTFFEQMRIWDNWNLMTNDMKRLSDIKSMELFGKTNEENHKLILKKYYKI
jgi:ABC-type lipopolysaccharide export system ATPase subunit